MKDIKFRVWANTDNGSEMVYLGCVDCDNGLWFDSSSKHIDDYKDDIMQYTGLTDKYEVAIYEGDVVKCGYGIGFVKEMLGAFWVEWIGSEDLSELVGLDSRFRRQREDEERFEVIGNIYENPELINHAI